MSAEDVAREAQDVDLARVAFEADCHEPRGADDFWKVAASEERRRYRSIASAVEAVVAARYEARIEALENELAQVFVPANENEWRART
jgi:hypothetical protein